MGTGDLDRAIADFDQAISLTPNSAAPYNSRGIAEAAKNDFDGALADFNQAIRLSPRYALAFNNRGFLYARHRNFDLAIADYDEAIRLKPDYALLTSTAVMSTLLKRTPVARSPTTSAAIGIDPKNIAAYDARALQYSFKGDSIWPLPITPRRSASILAIPISTPLAACLSQQERSRSRARRLRQGHCHQPERLAGLRLRLATSIREQGEFDHALAAYNASIGINPTMRCPTMVAALLIRPKPSSTAR